MCLRGYPFAKKRWKLYDLDKNEFFVSRDVVFDEEVYPYAEKKVTSATPIVPPVGCEFYDEAEQRELIVDKERSSGVTDQIAVNSEQIVSGVTEQITETVDNGVEKQSIQGESEELLGRGHRRSIPSIKLCDYVTYNAQNQLNKEGKDAGS